MHCSARAGLSPRNVSCLVKVALTDRDATQPRMRQGAVWLEAQGLAHRSRFCIEITFGSKRDSDLDNDIDIVCFEAD